MRFVLISLICVPLFSPHAVAKVDFAESNFCRESNIIFNHEKSHTGLPMKNLELFLEKRNETTRNRSRIPFHVVPAVTTEEKFETFWQCIQGADATVAVRFLVSVPETKFSETTRFKTEASDPNNYEAHFQMRQAIAEITDKFPGMSIYEVSRLVCDASGDNGEGIMDEFLGALPDDVQAESMELANKCIPLLFA